MSEITIKNPSRRGFLGTAAAVVGVGPAMSLLQSFGLSPVPPATSPATVLASSSADPASGYRCLNRDEASFTEAMVNALCPADHLTPNGVTCGLATAVDRSLAEAGVGARHFKDGIAAANTACRERFGVRFDQLAAHDAEGFLYDIAADRVSAPGVPLSSWLNEHVNPLLIQSCFAGPVYDGHCNRVFWKIFGHSGEPPATIRT